MKAKNKPLRSENQLLLNSSDKMKLKLITVNCDFINILKYQYFSKVNNLL